MSTPTPSFACRFVNLADDRTSREAQRFWLAVLDADGDGVLSRADARAAYDAVDKGDEEAFVVGVVGRCLAWGGGVR